MDLNNFLEFILMASAIFISFKIGENVSKLFKEFYNRCPLFIKKRTFYNARAIDINSDGVVLFEGEDKYKKKYKFTFSMCQFLESEGAKIVLDGKVLKVETFEELKEIYFSEITVRTQVINTNADELNYFNKE